MIKKEKKNYLTTKEKMGRKNCVVIPSLYSKQSLTISGHKQKHILSATQLPLYQSFRSADWQRADYKFTLLN